MRDLPDEKLQDFLDGRLSDAEHAEITARLRADPELARRVESWRKIGDTLRSADDEAELSPGFYARARERFEQQGRGAGRRGFHLLSWEAAGAAAAVVLAFALFAPELTRLREASRAPVAGPAESRSVAAEEGGDDMDRLETEEEPAEEPLRDEDFAPAPLAEKVAVAADAAAKEEVAPQAGLRIESETASAPPMRRAKSAAPDGFGPIVALPQGLALADGIGQVTDVSEWEAWLASSASAALAPLGGYRDDRRLVLVGRSGASCPSWTIARTPASGYRVRIGEGRAGTASGCAFLLPRDGLSVTLEE